MQVRKFLSVVCFLLGSALLVKAQRITTQQYIATYYQLAIDEQRRSGVPAAITLAQGVVETQSGNGTLCQQSNNHFGIKCKNTWTGKTIKYDDDEAQECFRVYDSAEESYRDHSDFLRNNPRYGFLFQFDGEDYKSWAYGLKQAGYATNKSYPQQLIKVIEDNNLQRYSLIALGKLSPEAVAAENAAIAGTVVNPKPRPVNNNNSSSAPSYNNSTASRPAKPSRPAGSYPKGVFEINGRKVIYAKAGTSLIALASQRDIRLSKLVRFNDLPNDAPLKKDMLIFLQKKSKRGSKDYHVVAGGETTHDVAQAEGIQLKWLRRRNKLHDGEEAAAGQQLALNGYASKTPVLAKATRILKEEEEEPEDFSPGKMVKEIKEEMSKPATGGVASIPPSKPGGVPVPVVAEPENNEATSVPAKAAMPKPAPAGPAPAPVRTAPAPVKSGGQLYHEVQPKETLYGIAKLYNKTVTQLQEWNNLQGYDIKIGQRLLVGK